MALSVEMAVEWAFLCPRWIVGNDSQSAFVGYHLSQMVCVISGVGHHDLGRKILDERSGLRRVARPVDPF